MDKQSSATFVLRRGRAGGLRFPLTLRFDSARRPAADVQRSVRIATPFPCLSNARRAPFVNRGGLAVRLRRKSERSFCFIFCRWLGRNLRSGAREISARKCGSEDGLSRRRELQHCFRDRSPRRCSCQRYAVSPELRAGIRGRPKVVVRPAAPNASCDSIVSSIRRASVPDVAFAARGRAAQPVSVRPVPPERVLRDPLANPTETVRHTAIFMLVTTISNDRNGNTESTPCYLPYTTTVCACGQAAPQQT